MKLRERPATMEDLEREHAEEAAELAAANEALLALAEKETELEGDLRTKRRWLSAWLGETDADKKMREKLLDSAEFERADPSALQAELVEGMRKLGELRREIKDAKKRHSSAEAGEKIAFDFMIRRKHREAVTATLQAEVSFAKALREERRLRDWEAGRLGRTVGELVNFAHGQGAHFALNDHWSMLNHRIRQAISARYLTGSEQWLADCNFKTGE
jgi:hypothetical protein